MGTIDSKKRFDGRVEAYAKFRPEYPAEAVDMISQAVGSGGVIADIGSGTGKLTKLLLERGYTVFAVEPNAQMRKAAEAAMGAYSGFRSVAAPAEATGLPEASVDAITVATAFHWFDHKKCGAEFRRILRPGGPVFILRNERETESDFMRRLSATLKRLGGAHPWSPEQAWRVSDDAYNEFFGRSYEKASFCWQVSLSYEELSGLVTTHSTMPEPGHPNYEPLIAAVRRLFEEHSENGCVTYYYRTDIVTGHFER